MLGDVQFTMNNEQCTMNNILCKLYFLFKKKCIFANVFRAR